MSYAAEEPATSGWTVVGQTAKTMPNSQGVLVPGIQIAFTTGSGQPGTVWVPEADYNVDTVRALILQRVKTIDAIQGLTS